jgi:hypothetical protein
MSYVRWSSDNFKSDLYVYEAEEGYMIHIASNRVVGNIPPVDWKFLLDSNWKSYAAQSKAQHEFLATAERQPIGLPFDGQTMVADDLEQLEHFLWLLKETGYIFPEWVLSTVREEIEEEKRGQLADIS